LYGWLLRGNTMTPSSGSRFDRLIGIAALFVTFIALFLSWQANNLLQEQNEIVMQSGSADIRNTSFEENERPTDMVVIGADCNSTNQDKHALLFSVYGNTTLSNVGGLSGSLLGVEFSGLIQNAVWSVGVSEAASNPDAERQELTFPLTIPSGESRILYLNATLLDTYSNFEEGLTSLIRWEVAQAATERLQVEWHFRFADGKELVQVVGVWFSIDPNARNRLSC